MVPTDPRQIELICLGLDPSKGPGHDGISLSVVRHSASVIRVPLSRLINVCLEAGHFPDFMKVAKVTPVFKADDPTKFGNYRPISVLSVFSKTFERAIQGRILSFLNRGGHLLSSQYGFCKGHSKGMQGKKGSLVWVFLLTLRRLLILWTMAFFWLNWSIWI